MPLPSRRRGISYIMSVVMMTLVITSLSSVVLFWGLSTIGESRVTLTAAIRGRMDRVREGLVVEDVQRIDSNHMRIYVRNTGDSQIVIDQIYIEHQSVTIVRVCQPGSTVPAPPTLCTTVATRLSLSIQSSGAVDVDVTGFPNDMGKSPAGCTTPVCLGSTYLIRAATTRGTTSVAQFSV